MDVFRFLKDIAKPIGGGLQAAVASRGGFQNICNLNLECNNSITIQIEISEDESSATPIWEYELVFSQQHALTTTEVVTENIRSDNSDVGYTMSLGGGFGAAIGHTPLSREGLGAACIRQTALEQESLSQNFRPLTHFFSNITYLHAVPQLIKFNSSIGGRTLENDPFGQAFLDKIANTDELERTEFLSKIQDVLVDVLPNLQIIEFYSDTKGRPQLRAKFSNHNSAAGWQNQEQFSDGTLRLIALFWQLLDGDNTLLLEEPELSLDEDIIRQLPRMIDELNRTDDDKPKRQIIISTHSSAMLENKGIDARYVLRLETGEGGTKIHAISEDDKTLIMSGFSAAEVILPKVHPKNASKMSIL